MKDETKIMTITIGANVAKRVRMSFAEYMTIYKFLCLEIDDYFTIESMLIDDSDAGFDFSSDSDSDIETF